jgi:murein DD-endopeptidase MepM/ murein hydrolase activator NlpD
MTDADRRKLLNRAIARLRRTKEGYNPEGGHWRAAMAMLDELDQDLKPDTPPKPKVPLLGPVQAGGPSLLKASLTHQTAGLPLYPAYDTAWVAGSLVISPENGEVTRHSGGESTGYSVYVTGESGLRYYLTHLNPEQRRPIGPVQKGQKLGVVGSAKRFPGARVAHCHFGVNAEQMLGAGKQLKYGKYGRGPDYTQGAPTIGAQLAKVP